MKPEKAKVIIVPKEQIEKRRLLSGFLHDARCPVPKLVLNGFNSYFLVW